jgi:hypothetical protein
VKISDDMVHRVLMVGPTTPRSACSLHINDESARRDGYRRIRLLALLLALALPMAGAEKMLEQKAPVAANEVVEAHCLWSWAEWYSVEPAGPSCFQRRARWQDLHDEARSIPQSAHCASAHSLPGPVGSIQHLVAGVRSQYAQPHAI